jgi:hypothetical protein
VDLSDDRSRLSDKSNKYQGIIDLFKNLAVLSQVPLNLPHNGGKFSFFSREVVQKLRFLNNSNIVKQMGNFMENEHFAALDLSGNLAVLSRIPLLEPAAHGGKFSIRLVR